MGSNPFVEAQAARVDRAPHAEWAKAEVVVGPDGGSLSTGVLQSPLELAGDWTGILIGFGLDPDVFEVVDDTVKMNKWQQSKGLEDGTRNTVWLYSYSARFTRRAPKLREVDFDRLLKGIAKWKPPSRKGTGNGTDVPCTFLVCLADLQIGKSQGGGIEGALERIMAALGAAVLRLAELRKTHNVERVVLANMGDPIEGCDGNYASQLFTIKASLREQLNIALQTFITWCETLGADEFLTVLSNHSEWMRRDGKQVTGDSDSADGYLADTLRLLFEMTGKGPTTWRIPHDEMITMANLSGVNVAFTHGHKIPSAAKEAAWLAEHSIRLLRDQGSEPRIWVTAHRHHYQATDYGPWFRFQCPSLDGGSKWFTDMTGEWATPGLLTMLVGEHDVRGWSDVALL